MNKRLNNLRKTIAQFIAPTKNAMSLPAQFLKYGGKSMKSDWTEIIMSDQDLYTGYGYASIRNRANLVARLALENVYTDTDQEGFIHPHLDMISKSKTFTDYKFWSDISTYLDLEGIYYLMAVRASGEGKTGAVKEFKLLSPYNIRRVMSSDRLEVSGYVESRNGFVREISKELIIEIRELNPFDEDNPYAMTDAAKESQFTLKTASDYTRHALKGNINAPGILSTDLILEEEEFKRFIDRVRAHTKGEPIFGNGQGAITWENMQIELSKAALHDVNEINRESLFAVSGVSKTIMGIEQSGVTRETSKVQRDLIIENHILPRIQLIIDALNQDYENNYPNEYANHGASIVVKNPLGTDHDAELKDTEVKTKQLDLFSRLVNRKVGPEIAAKYVIGEASLEDLGLEPMEFTPIPADDEDNEEGLNDRIKNQIKKESSGIIQQQEGALKNEIQNIEGQVVAGMLNRLKNKVKGINQIQEVDLDSEFDLITKTEKRSFIKDLAFLLGAFYGIVITLRGGETMRGRTGEFTLPGLFKLDKGINKRIKDLSGKVADSHINTIVNDIYKVSRDAALEGKSLTEIENLIKQKYAGQISETRASTIARTETNRAFTIAQYEADRQFVEQNKLEGRVFKRWRTRSSNPCPFCLALESEGLVPFGKNFRNIGDTVNAEGKTLDVGFESLQAGNAHPNCSCTYELIIRDASDNSLQAQRQELEKKEKELREAFSEFESIL